ncbi:uncharacterized protein LOC131240016 isoform X2 [Magnolia sinica]|uniref:uncharacterized protein LOC131240016 isoform X2 n=1 Tax=Magnolia sinica TaxID=86752 RepID=UPI00265998D0|nr:uncharacterized protein LOC131240016 isoform X2 [Magnolia sinica]
MLFISLLAISPSSADIWSVGCTVCWLSLLSLLDVLLSRWLQENLPGASSTKIIPLSLENIRILIQYFAPLLCPSRICNCGLKDEDGFLMDKLHHASEGRRKWRQGILSLFIEMTSYVYVRCAKHVYEVLGFLQ